MKIEIAKSYEEISQNLKKLIEFAEFRSKDISKVIKEIEIKKERNEKVFEKFLTSRVIMRCSENWMLISTRFIIQ
jgi:effector-binding domain-containing protein